MSTASPSADIELIRRTSQVTLGNLTNMVYRGLSREGREIYIERLVRRHVMDARSNEIARHAWMEAARSVSQDWSFIALGKCTPERRIGEGGQCEGVYKLVSPKTGIAYAVKVYQRNRFNADREIPILRKLVHPGVCSVYTVKYESNFAMVVFPFCERGDLFNHIRHEKRLCEDDARHIFQQLVDAVEYCHANGVYHRDLKPENVLIQAARGAETPMRTGWHPGDRVLLTDFGLSLMAGDGRCYSLDTGTTAYSPPEMFDVAVRPASLQHVEQSSAGAGYAGDKVDIWSLGAILYVVLKGKHPFGQCPSSFDALDTSGLSNSARDLVAQLLVVVPAERPTLAHIKAHPWLQQSAAKVPETGAAAGPMQVVSSTGSVPSMGLSSANVNSLPSLDSQSAAALDDAMVADGPDPVAVQVDLLVHTYFHYQPATVQELQRLLGHDACHAIAAVPPETLAGRLVGLRTRLEQTASDGYISMLPSNVRLGRVHATGVAQLAAWIWAGSGQQQPPRPAQSVHEEEDDNVIGVPVAPELLTTSTERAAQLAVIADSL
eukprot:COSAG05_NODE_299_length_11928_cov_3.933469_5_plen_549_part_00